MTDGEFRSHLKPGSRSGQANSARDKVTPEWLFLSRRKFILGLGATAAAVALTACTKGATGVPTSGTPGFCDDARAAGTADELGAKLTTCADVTNYNNFYEFSYGKEDLAGLATKFKTSPWTVTVGGLVDKPGSFSVEELISNYQPRERIYRMRCVEAWSMVIPWVGFPLNQLLKDVQPRPGAKFVRFLSFYDPAQMPGDSTLPFPYFEGLRMDEAMHDLTILATGLYGKPLPAQDGAPIRLVVPWKYGFKSAKSILSIELTADMPSTFWPTLASNEYGFYANVNPNVDHPRWSQSSERRIGEAARMATLMFNGYDQVAPLYQGMDLRANY
jgi:methionine sulfoxide reductase catalytic subunit